MENQILHVKITAFEWRWVMSIALVWTFLSFFPIIIINQVLDSDWAFMGVAVNPKDGGSYLAKIDHGAEGHWAYRLQHTPQSHNEAYVFTFYLFLGQLGALVGLKALTMFHLARISTSIFMFAGVYWLGAHIWSEVALRRRYVLLSTFVTGFGWLAAILTPGTEPLPPDLVMPEAFPYYAVFANAHFPMSLGCMAIVVGIIGEQIFNSKDIAPSYSNLKRWLILVACSFILATTQPPALALLVTALGVFGIWQTINRRRISLQTSVLFAMISLPAVVIGLYYIIVFSKYAVWQEYDAQSSQFSPNVFFLTMSFGVFILINIPGWWQSRHRPINSYTKFMLGWLAVVCIALYLPFALQRRFLIGITYPLAYFAVLATRDYWTTTLSLYRQRLLVFFLILMVFPTYIISLSAPIFIVGEPARAMLISGIVLPDDYLDSFVWLEKRTVENDVILAAPSVGLWLPSRSNGRTVYGHEFETIPEAIRLKQVKAFYRGDSCDLLYDTDLGFKIRYVFWGPAEDIFRQDILADSEQVPVPRCLILLRETLPESHINRIGKISIFTLDDTIRADLARLDK